ARGQKGANNPNDPVRARKLQRHEWQPDLNNDSLSCICDALKSLLFRDLRPSEQHARHCLVSSACVVRARCQNLSRSSLAGFSHKSTIQRPPQQPPSLLLLTCSATQTRCNLCAIWVLRVASPDAISVSD